MKYILEINYISGYPNKAQPGVLNLLTRAFNIKETLKNKIYNVAQ